MKTKILFGRLTTILTAISLLLMSFLLPVSASASVPEQPQASVDPLVLEQLSAQGETTFWVILREKADLRPAYTMNNWEARGRFVYQRLQAVANASQASIRSLLQGRGVAHRPVWIANAIQVTADKATLQELSARPEVAQIIADGTYQIPEPLPGNSEPGVNAVEWNIDRIGAPQVWSTFGVRGEGIVVANIDTGVEFTHSALVNQYRGNLGGGNFDHNYNWFDPSQVCGSPSLVPCDNNSHGTHTMGTMVGDDGNQNQIGVAPGARWIAAKGCESSSCSFSALMAAGQWVLAPTDLNGQNPRADLRPHVVNNSWGGGPGDSFYQDIVNAWVASGIFPQFSNGNSGPGCFSSGSPGDYPQSYSAGAFDINNQIAWFSSRGPSAFGVTKPDISAPGVDVRSSVPGNGYAFFSGTSMASPHVAGTVALMWSAAPTLLGDIESTRALLDQTALDVDDTSCGGSAADNNVWGEGRLDALAAVDLSPRGPTGTLQGALTDANTSLPLSGVTVNAVGPSNRSTITDASGNYSMVLPVGTYDVSVGTFGYLGQTASVEIAEGGVTVQDFALMPAPAHEVFGTVRNEFGDSVGGVTVSILATPIPPAMTDGNGFYSFASVPEGEYDVYAAAGACNDPQTQHLVIDGDEILDFTLAQRSDAYGYTCEIAQFSFIDASNDTGMYGDDTATGISLPFPFTFYGLTYQNAWVSTNGHLNFLAYNNSLSGGPIPDFYPPDAAIYLFWDDLYVDPGMASVRTELLGSAPNRQFVIEWRDVAFCCISSERVRFEVVLNEDGSILTQYTSIDADSREQGQNATLGIENETSSIALQYSFHRPVITDGLAVRYIPPPMGSVEGYITDAGTSMPIPGATVTIAEIGATITPDLDGYYRVVLPAGNYNFTASAFGYEPQSASVTVVEDGATTQDFHLTSLPRFTVSGHVRDNGNNPLANASVTILGVPLPSAVTDSAGYYTIPGVPQGAYDVRAMMGHCTDEQFQYVVVNSDVTQDFTLSVREDAFGYRCQVVPSDWVEGTDVLPLTGAPNSTSVTLPFNFSLYGQEYGTAYVSTNGFLNFLSNNYAFYNDYIPTPNEPNAAIYPFWDELYVLGGDSVIKTATIGTAPNRIWVLEYENVAWYWDLNTRLNFEVKLYESSGQIEFLYGSMPGSGNGDSATIGIENAEGTDAFLYSFYESVVSDGLAIRYSPPRFGFVEGRVTDAADGTPLDGVQVKALEADRTTTTDADGRYRMLLREGAYTLEASLSGYNTEQAAVNILDQQTTTQNFSLRSPRAQVTPGALEFVVPAGQTRTQTLALGNIGQADLTFFIGEMTVPMVMSPEALPDGIDAQTAPEGYHATSVASVNAGGPVLVFMDNYPWGSDAIFQVLNANGIAFDVANSSQMSAINMSQYEVVFISSDQPTSFYSNYAASFSRFEDYVQNGGFLWVGAAAWGWNGGDFTGGLLPGGATVVGFYGESYNNVLDPTHPTVQGVPNPFHGTGTSHTYFTNLPAGTNVIASGQNSGQPTLIEYDFGGGRVLALAQTLEFGFYYGQDAGRILENGVPYAYSFEPFVDIPWLSEDVVTGTVLPSNSQAISVSVNTTGLTPGIYRARLIIVTNDPRNQRIQVPVTLIVPAYMQGVNAGGNAYVDQTGDQWAADRQYAAGSFGYVTRSTTMSTRRDIVGTLDDRLYQDLRQNALEYRFDNLPPGVYQIELLFAEIKNALPNTRRYDVMIEGQVVLLAHDTALEVGSFTADNHTFYVLVTDGQLNIRFISYRSYGQPILNAVRVTHRPDR